MSLKTRAIEGIKWSTINVVMSYGIQFVVGVVLARLLSPEEFGLIGMTAILTAVAQTFVDSGFSTALIRKKKCTQAEYSTVFIYNILTSVLIYIIIYVYAPYIARFFGVEKLTNLIRVIGINIVILAVSQIQRTILIKEINFRRLTTITVISSLFSGLISIILAFSGYGVWSLVLQQLIRAMLESLLLWLAGRWRPSITFSIDAFRDLFAFGGKLLASGLLNTIYQNIYNLAIGKYFSASDLGFYTKAHRFSSLVGPNLNTVIQSVAFPVMAEFSDETDRLRTNFKRILVTTTFASFVLSLLMAACSEAIILVLLGEQWAQSIPYLQLLCFTAMMFPIHAVNLNLLKVKGRSDLFLKLEIYKKLLAVPVIIVGIKYGIVVMIVAQIVVSVVALYLNTYYTGRILAYPAITQIRDIGKGFWLAIAIATPVYITGQLLKTQPSYTLGIQALLGALGVIGVLSISTYSGAKEVESIALEYTRKWKSRCSKGR